MSQCRIHSARCMFYQKVVPTILRSTHLSRLAVSQRTSLFLAILHSRQAVLPGDSLRQNGSQHRFHFLHLVIIVDHHHASGQHHHGKSTAQASQHPDAAAPGGDLTLIFLHPLSEIPHHRFSGACFHPADILTHDHIILHHLVPLIVYVITSQLIESVLRCYVNRFLSLQSGVQIHQLVFPCKILSMLFPVI